MERNCESVLNLRYILWMLQFTLWRPVEIEVTVSCILNLALDGCKWWASGSIRFNLLKKTRYWLNKRLVGTQWPVWKLKRREKPLSLSPGNRTHIFRSLQWLSCKKLIIRKMRHLIRSRVKEFSMLIWSWVLLEKLRVSQLVKQFITSYFMEHGC